ncbi:hypothetical protein ST47_g935 [Ascochyta rabiei]|uniref:Uncharacterized protein n=1 Tax=Didymella rabiei TaxID=5454 RepID=A0A163LM62_DIDRA|nr:hypothetical protein ST47_g935 [Ascochyta rabiei]
MATQYAPVRQDTSYPAQQCMPLPSGLKPPDATCHTPHATGHTGPLVVLEESIMLTLCAAPMQMSPNANADWHAQIAETDEEVRRERDPFNCGYCSVPSCSRRDGKFDCFDSWLDFVHRWTRCCY